MAEEYQTTNVESEIKDRGVFDFLGKKEEEKPQEEVIATDLQKVHISEPEEKVHISEYEETKEEEKRPSLLEKLHRSDSSSSSSSSEEEVEEGGEKIRRKKKKTLKEKILGEKEEEKKVEAGEDGSIPIEKLDYEVGVVTHAGDVPHPEEKKSFIEKIKEKVSGTQKKPEESGPVAAEPVEFAPTEAEPKEKKGILEKIKEKLPGYHKNEEEKKESSEY